MKSRFYHILILILICFSAFSQSPNDGIVPPVGGKTKLQLSEQARQSKQEYQILMTNGNKKVVYWDTAHVKELLNLGKVDSIATVVDTTFFYDRDGVVVGKIVKNGTDTRLQLSVVNDSIKIEVVDVLTNTVTSTSYLDNMVNQPDIITTITDTLVGGHLVANYNNEANTIRGIYESIIQVDSITNGYVITKEDGLKDTIKLNATGFYTLTSLDDTLALTTIAASKCPVLTVAKLDSCNVAYLFMFNCGTGSWELFKTPNIYTAGKTLFVDEVTGNDATAKKGCPTCAFKTIDAAILKLEDGDLLKVLAGNYENSISSTKYFNIDCDNGVNWEIKSKLLNQSPLRKFGKMSWKFDRIFSNTYFDAYSDDTIIKTNIYANEVDNIGIGSGSLNEIVSIDRCIDCKTGIYSSSANTISNVHIKNMTSTKTYGVANFNSFPIQAKNSSANIVVDNININHSSLPWEGVFNFDYGDGGNRKYNLHLHNVIFNPTNQYTSLPPLYSGKSAYGLDGDNTLVYIGNSLRDSTIANIEIDNYKGSGHAVVVNGYGNTIGQTLLVKIRGTFYRGIPFSLEQLYSWSINTKIIIDLDVDCYDGIGVLLGIDGIIDIPSTSSITITGKIRTHNNPCVVLQGSTNGRVFLDKLTMVNDGGTYSVESNSAQNIIVKPGCASNVLTSPNVTQLGTGIYVDPNFNN